MFSEKERAMLGDREAQETMTARGSCCRALIVGTKILY